MAARIIAGVAQVGLIASSDDIPVPPIKATALINICRRVGPPPSTSHGHGFGSQSLLLAQVREVGNYILDLLGSQNGFSPERIGHSGQALNAIVSWHYRFRVQAG